MSDHEKRLLRYATIARFVAVGLAVASVVIRVLEGTMLQKMPMDRDGFACVALALCVSVGFEIAAAIRSKGQ